ncbi:molybdopterin-dependent oxidoreductase [Streptomyces sp. NPDC049954]|uniref:molybdopterin-dependent oxidoreductase n=1 Tax=Streptomyces sp. NPDC049954 TaxID=3155779 RepID=UPI00343182A8
MQTRPQAAPRPLRRLPRLALGALGGVLSGYAALALAELVAAAVRPEAGPVVAVGGAAVDRTPVEVKDWAIRHFGTNDKLVLQLGILAVLTLFAVVLGAFATRFRRTGAAGVLLFGVVGATAALSRPDSEGFTDALPSLVGAVAGAVLLYVLVGLLGGWRARGATAPAGPRGNEDAPGDRTDTDTDGTDTDGTDPDGTDGSGASAAGPGSGPGWDRRRFVLLATAAAAVSTGAGAAGRALSGAGSADAVASRKAVRLPRARSAAAPVPAGARLHVPGLSSFTTPNADFYRVDTALVVPKVNADTWRLRVHGEGVRSPLTLSFQDLLRRELIERDITLTCVSNEVGGGYVGNARWIGVPLAPILREAGVRPPSRGGKADQLVARSVDGMTLGSPVETVMDGRDAMLAVGMNGEPLPFAHGFPVRMLVPGLYGYVSACKWVEDLELTTFDSYDPYWVKRSWAKRAPIKTQARIDTPKPFGRPKKGTVMVAGVAWAQHRGIEKVEIQVDDGPWRRADLAAEDTKDTWRQWSWPWRATPGGHTLTVRATDATGTTQTTKRTGTVPDGASGHHSVVVTVD